MGLLTAASQYFLRLTAALTSRWIARPQWEQRNMVQVLLTGTCLLSRRTSSQRFVHRHPIQITGTEFGW